MKTPLVIGLAIGVIVVVIVLKLTPARPAKEPTASVSTLSVARWKSSDRVPDQSDGHLSTEQRAMLESARKDLKAWFRALKTLSPSQLLFLLEDDFRSENSSRDLRYEGVVVRDAAAADPAATIAWLQAHAEIVRMHPEFWAEAIDGWKTTDIDSVFDYLRERVLEDPERWSDMLPGVFQAGLKNDVSWFESHLAKLPLAAQYIAVGGPNMWTWSGKDPAAAAKWILQFPASNNGQEYLVGSAFAHWASQSPEKAWGVVDHLTGKNYDAALSGYARGIMLRSVDEGVAFLDQLRASGRSLTQGPPGTDSVLEIIGTHLGRADGNRGLQLLPRLTDPKERDVFAYAFFNQYADSHPKETIGLLREMGPTYPHVLDQAARSWGTKDGASAVAWVLAQPNDGSRRALLEAVFDGWTNRAPAAATAYIQTMPPSSDRDAAQHSWCISYIHVAPDVAMATAEKIEGSEERADAMKVVGWNWVGKDQSAFARWLQAASPQDRQILQEAAAQLRDRAVQH